MNRYLTLIICLVTVVFFNSCREEIKTTAVKIESMTDTTFVSKIDGRSITFDIKKAQYDNGFVMSDDSVVVYYVGDLRDGKVIAAVVRLIPKKGNVVDAVYDPSKDLKTAPMSEEEQKSFEKGIEYTRKHNK